MQAYADGMLVIPKVLATNAGKALLFFITSMAHETFLSLSSR
jgi:hypothetical protein